jgi:hypothetical protein
MPSPNLYPRCIFCDKKANSRELIEHREKACRRLVERRQSSCSARRLVARSLQEGAAEKLFIRVDERLGAIGARCGD